jgi:chromosome segregation ATPase
MPKITDTYTLAYACCETILKELQRFPTIDLIRERIGVNSPNTIKKAMNDWTTAFAKHYIEQQRSPLECPGVPSLLTDTLYQLWKDTVSEAQQRYTEQAALLQDNIVQLQHTISQQQVVLIDADLALHEAGMKMETLEAELMASTADKIRLQTELLATQQREHTLNQVLEQQQQRESELSDQYQHRLQQEQDWMQRRILEERELAANKGHDKQDQLEQRLTLVTTHLEHTQQALHTIQTHNQQLLTEIARLKSQLENATKNVLPVHRFKRNRARR